MQKALAEKVHPWDKLFRELVYQSHLHLRFVAAASDIEIVDINYGIESRVRPPLLQGSVCSDLLREAAMEQMCSLLRGLDGSGPHIFNCPALDSSVTTLRAGLQQEGSLVDLASKKWVAHNDVAVSGPTATGMDRVSGPAAHGKMLFLSVSVSNPEVAKQLHMAPS